MTLSVCFSCMHTVKLVFWPYYSHRFVYTVFPSHTFTSLLTLVVHLPFLILLWSYFRNILPELHMVCVHFESFIVILCITVFITTDKAKASRGGGKVSVLKHSSRLHFFPWLGCSVFSKPAGNGLVSSPTEMPAVRVPRTRTWTSNSGAGEVANGSLQDSLVALRRKDGPVEGQDGWRASPDPKAAKTQSRVLIRKLVGANARHVRCCCRTCACLNPRLDSSIGLDSRPCLNPLLDSRPCCWSV